MRIISYFLRAIILLATIYFVGGFLLPSEWSVSRSLTISARPEKIYPYLANFKEWESWSPWNASKDSSLKYTYEGPEQGMNAKQSWTSEKMGSGWMKFITASVEEGVSYELFIDMHGSKSTILGSIHFSKDASGQALTEVTWTDRGDAGKKISNRWMSLLLKPILGKDMSKGLANLKTIVEN